MIVLLVVIKFYISVVIINNLVHQANCVSAVQDIPYVSCNPNADICVFTENRRFEALW